MKNLIICLFFSCSFLLGNSITLTAGKLDVEELMIIATKTGQTICSFALPKGYQPKSQMLEVSLSNEKGLPVYTEVSTDLMFLLPAGLSGNFNLSVKVNGIVFTQQITL